LGVGLLWIGFRLVPMGWGAGGGRGLNIDDYTAEARLPPGSQFVGRTVAELEHFGEGEVTIAAIVRENYRRYVPSAHWVLFAGDILVLEGDTTALAELVKRAGLRMMHDKDQEGVEHEDDIAVVEAVVEQRSAMIGHSIEEVNLRERFGANLLAISRRGRPIRQRLRRVRLQSGDLVVLQCRQAAVADTLAELGCLPLAERNLAIGRTPKRAAAVAVLGLTIILVASGLVPVAIGFFGAAVAMTALKVVSLREAYEAIEWPILVLLGSLIPVSETLRTTGGTELIAGFLSEASQGLPPIGSLAMMMVAAMAVTPFLNNAATVLVMAPIGASLATHLGLRPDAFLMAVAIGAGCDFLTPIGHQCNTLVMGPGGYRFGDYWRLGLPLSIMVVVIGTAAIALFWPLVPR
jgi:di/tricarboxylate transporter